VSSAAIDGSGAGVHGPEDQGVLILLPDQRLIVFGRPPSSDAPGELPAERKWRAVSSALAELGRGGDAAFWDLADVRWDVPELRYRGEAAPRVVALLAAPAAAPADPGWPASWSTGGNAAPSAAPEPEPGPRPASSAAGRPRVR